MLKRLLLLSFIEGAAVMAAELCGARLLAPIFGSSLYVWAAVMGITLAALAAGYFYGGLLSQKPAPMKSLLLILALAALFLLLMPVISHYLVPRISYLPFLTGIVISATLLLVPPIFFLGASSPLFIKIQTSGDNSGRVSGTVYAVSTAGGIFSTFACGFWLIPVMGLTWCLLLSGILLFLAVLLTGRSFPPVQLFLFLGFLYLNLQLGAAPGVLYQSDSLMGRLQVLDLTTDTDAIRILKVNNIVQTEMDLATKASVSGYVRLLDTLVPFAAKRKNALVLGLGGGLTANLLVRKNYSCTGVELDERITQMAKTYFYLHPGVKAVDADARYFLNQCKEVYDVVLVDIFKAEEQPSHVLTLESLQQLKKNLSDSALLLINWHGYAEGEKGTGTAVLYNTLVEAGYHVTLSSTGNQEQSRNIMFVASLRELKNIPYAMAYVTGNETTINTDDLPVLEKYNARANMDWRINYLRYYQNQAGSRSIKNN